MDSPRGSCDGGGKESRRGALSALGASPAPRTPPRLVNQKAALGPTAPWAKGGGGGRGFSGGGERPAPLRSPLWTGRGVSVCLERRLCAAAEGFVSSSGSPAIVTGNDEGGELLALEVDKSRGTQDCASHVKGRVEASISARFAVAPLHFPSVRFPGYSPLARNGESAARPPEPRAGKSLGALQTSEGRRRTAHAQRHAAGSGFQR